MAIARRLNTPPPPAQSGGTVNIFDDSFYTGSMGLPEGNYAFTFHTAMFSPTKADGSASRTPPFLAVIVTAYPIDPQSGALIGEPEEHPFGLGSDAHESFVPSADGKGFDAVPNGKKQGVWKLSNWGILLDSLKNAGLPPGLGSNDLSVIDGIWVHTQNIPEPEEKQAAAKRARAKTGASAMMGQQEDRGPRNVTIVTEILDNGKPWEGTGGIPAETAAPKTKPAARPAPRAVPARPVSVQAAAAVSQFSDDDIQGAVVDGLSKVLSAPGAPTMKVALKTKTFEAIKKEYGDDVAQAAMDAYLQSDEMLNAALSGLSYKIVGLQVKPL